MEILLVMLGQLLGVAVCIFGIVLCIAGVGGVDSGNLNLGSCNEKVVQNAKKEIISGIIMAPVGVLIVVFGIWILMKITMWGKTLISF